MIFWTLDPLMDDEEGGALTGPLDEPLEMRARPPWERLLFGADAFRAWVAMAERAARTALRSDQ